MQTAFCDYSCLSTFGVVSCLPLDCDFCQIRSIEDPGLAQSEGTYWNRSAVLGLINTRK